MYRTERQFPPGEVRAMYGINMQVRWSDYAIEQISDEDAQARMRKERGVIKSVDMSNRTADIVWGVGQALTRSPFSRIKLY